MRQKILGLIVATILLSGCGLSAKKSGIEIVSYPNAKVYIDGKEAGMTPYNNRTMKTGEVKVRLELGEGVWEKTVHAENGASTVINREFGKNADLSGGYILYFESTGDKNRAGLLISTKPDRATIKIDDEVKGESPLRIDNIGEGDRKLMMSFPGYKNLNSFVKFINGYQLVVEADLAKEEVVITPEVTEASTITSQNNGGAPSTTVDMVAIKKTETGWLRVRDTAAANGVEVAKVKPTEQCKLLEEKDGWYKIDLGNGITGWISAKYADKKTAI